MPTSSSPSPAPSRRAGFSLIEVLISLSLLAVGLLAHVASLTSEQALEREQQARIDVIQVARQMVERLRADPDWATLYDRLRTMEDQASQGGQAVRRLADGRKAYAPQLYYADFELETRVQQLGVLVEVPPRGKPTSKPHGLAVLREDTPLPHFAMPADLDFDGDIDGEGCEDEYAVLPVVVVLGWTGPGGRSEELRFGAWLWGDR